MPKNEKNILTSTGSEIMALMEHKKMLMKQRELNRDVDDDIMAVNLELDSYNEECGRHFEMIKSKCYAKKY